MKQLCIALIGLGSLTTVYAFDPAATQKYFNGPTVTVISSSSARFFLQPIVLGGMTDEEKSRVYFEYARTNMVCPAIYPVPEYCLPKKTEIGKTDVVVMGLLASTTYTVLYKRDNTIRCITTPCPENGFDSVAAEFTTPGGVKSTPHTIRRNLRYRERGDDVTSLQMFLIKKGYLHTEATGYFGVQTLKAVKEFQRDCGVAPTGFVGVMTRGKIEVLP